MCGNTVTSAILKYRVYFKKMDWPENIGGRELVHESELRPYFDQGDRVVWRNAALDLLDSQKVAESLMNEFMDRVQDVLDNRPVKSRRVQ